MTLPSAGATTTLAVWNAGGEFEDGPRIWLLVVAVMALPAAALGVASAEVRGSLWRRLATLQLLAIGGFFCCVLAVSAMLPEASFDIDGSTVPAVIFAARYAHILLLPTLVAVAVLTRWTRTPTPRALPPR